MDSLWHVKDGTETVAERTWPRYIIDSPDNRRIAAMVFDPIKCSDSDYTARLIAAFEIAQHVARLPRLQAAAQQAITAIEKHGLADLLGDVRSELQAGLDGTPPRRLASNGMTLGHADMPHSEAILSQGGACP